MSETPFGTTLDIAAAALHEMFLALQKAGFTPDEALTLVSKIFKPEVK